MKVCFSQKEVEQIMLEFVQRTLSQHLNEVRINNYTQDYCVVTRVDPDPAPESD